MNIFYLGYSLKENSGGIENYTFAILSRLKQQGHNVLVCTINGANENFENISFSKNKYIDRFFLGDKIAWNLYKKEKEIDIFLCGHLFLAKWMEKIIKRYKSNYDLFVYGIDCWAGRFEKRKAKLKKINRIISISSFTTKQIRKQGFKNDIIYFPPLLDTSKFPEIKINRQKNKIIKFITVGRLSAQEQYKGHDKVIEAVNILINKHNIPNLEYRIVGKGNDKERLENKVKSLKLENNIKFYGFVSNSRLSELYATSDVFIMPSNVSLNPEKPEGEGFGIVFTEAALYELPLIGPNTGGSTDIIDNNINGLECDPLDIVDIANKMKIFINDRKKRIEFGKMARQKIFDDFTLNQIDTYLYEVIKK